MARKTFLVVLLIITSASIFTPVSASPIDKGECIGSTESVESDHADITAVVQKAPNQSNAVRITYKQLSPDDRLDVRLPSDVSIIQATGFSQATDTATVRYSGGDRAILEYKIGTQSKGTQYANGSDWIFAPTPTHIGDVGVNLQIKPAGVVGNEFLYIGNYTKYSTAEGCHEISLVDSEAGKLPGDPEEIIRALEYAAENLDIGHKYEQVTIFATPGFAQPPNAGFARDSDAWVTKSTGTYNFRSYTRVVLHEYIHTRQAYSRGATSEMSWIIEGSAEYFSYQLAHEIGAISSEEYNHWLRNGSQINVELTNRTDWGSNYVPYGRGGAYLAVLDSRIQATSNQSVESVFHQINAIGGDESYVIVQRSLFLTVIENSSSVSVRDWANNSMGSAASFNITAATVNLNSTTFIESLGDDFERRTAKMPYKSFLIAMMMGVILGMLPYELRREKEQQSESDADDGSESQER